MKFLGEQELKSRWKTPEGEFFKNIILAKVTEDKWINWETLSLENDGEKIMWLDFPGVEELSSLQTERMTGIMLLNYQHTFFQQNAINNVKYADFRGIELHDMKFNSFNVPGFHLNNSFIFNCEINNGIFVGANLNNTWFNGTVLNNTRLNNIQMENGCLRETRILNSYLMNSNLSYTDMYCADFTGTYLDGARFKLKTWSWRILEVFGKTKDILTNKPNIVKGAEFLNARINGDPILYRNLLDEQYLDDFSQRYRKLYKFWLITSNCGRSVSLLLVWSLIIALFFGIIFSDFTSPPWMPKIISNAFDAIDPHFSYNGKSQSSLWQPFYLSFVTMTTLGVSSVEPINAWGYFWHIILNVVGYGWLGYLIAVLGSKLTRRSA